MTIWPYLALCLAVLALGAVLYVIRWILMGGKDQTQPGLSIDQIDALHERGLLSDEEYRRARRAALGLSDEKPATQAAEKLDQLRQQE